MRQSAAADRAAWIGTAPETVAENLALDEVLLDSAQAGRLAGPVVRTWMAPTPTVVLGSSSRVADEVDLAGCAAVGATIVRRPSGGLTVLLGPGCLVWSVISPHPIAVPPLEVLHATTLEPLAAALRAAGRPVERRGSSDLALIAAGQARKISGNALRVRRSAVLYHGTLLDSFDLGLIARVLRHPPREPDYRAGRAHGEFVANLALGRRPLDEAVRAAFRADETTDDWPRDRVAALAAERYADPDWTHRL